ncbi:hypothetical protein C8J56DRAFT_879878 [Mycena floridula]|nr:hypothetical protein C8J56DRAFT_879878 [Mycena floridula]
MSSIMGGLTVEQFCTGWDNYPEFKERFILAMEAQGLAKIILGTQIAPMNELTLDTIMYDLSGAQTGVTKKQILATGPGSSKPTKDKYQFRERQANAGLFACVINLKSYGLETTKSASENWKKLDDVLGKGSMTEQIVSRDELLSACFTPSHESKTEYDNYAKSFQELCQRAVAAGGEYTDSLLQITYIISIDNEDYINAASNIAVNANLETTISFLHDTWLIRHQRKVKELGAQALVARANAVTAASAQTPSGLLAFVPLAIVALDLASIPPMGLSVVVRLRTITWIIAGILEVAMLQIALLVSSFLLQQMLSMLLPILPLFPTLLSSLFLMFLSYKSKFPLSKSVSTSVVVPACLIV